MGVTVANHICVWESVQSSRPQFKPGFQIRYITMPHLTPRDWGGHTSKGHSGCTQPQPKELDEACMIGPLVALRIPSRFHSVSCLNLLYSKCQFLLWRHWPPTLIEGFYHDCHVLHVSSSKFPAPGSLVISWLLLRRCQRPIDHPGSSTRRPPSSCSRRCFYLRFC